MAVLKNEDIAIMVEVEDLLHKKLVATNGIKDIYQKIIIVMTSIIWMEVK